MLDLIKLKAITSCSVFRDLASLSRVKNVSIWQTNNQKDRERESWSTKTSEDLKRALGPLESLQATSTSSLRRQINYDERVITIVKKRTNERAQNGFYRVEGLFCFDCFRDKISLISWAVVVAQLAWPSLPKLEFRCSNPVIGVTVTVENTKIKRPGMVDYNITHFHISLIMAKFYWFQLYLCVMTCI